MLRSATKKSYKYIAFATKKWRNLKKIVETSLCDGRNMTPLIGVRVIVYASILSVSDLLPPSLRIMLILVMEFQVREYKSSYVDLDLILNVFRGNIQRKVI